MKIKPITEIWKISPGEEGMGWHDCLKNGTIGIGYSYDRDLHGLTEEQVIEHQRRTRISKPGYLSDPIDFLFHVKKGHVIVAYSSPSTIYGIGIVEENGWKYNKSVSRDTYWLRNTRKVNWIQPFPKIKTDSQEVISELGVRQTIKAIPKKLFIDKILPLIPGNSKTKIYDQIISSKISDFPSIEEDEIDLSFKEKEKLRLHKSFDRDPKLIKEAKKIHGYTCMACGFNYEEKYGEIGKNYIEAHHLIPFAELDINANLSPKKDVAVLCANCHRMIHRFEDTSNIKKFKKLIK